MDLVQSLSMVDFTISQMTILYKSICYLTTDYQGCRAINFLIASNSLTRSTAPLIINNKLIKRQFATKLYGSVQAKCCGISAYHSSRRSSHPYGRQLSP